MGVYDKEPLSCNGHSDKNISEFVNGEGNPDDMKDLNKP